MTNPILIVPVVILIGLVVMTFLMLLVPWIDYVAERLRLNPFAWINEYFSWCEKKKAEMKKNRSAK